MDIKVLSCPHVKENKKSNETNTYIQKETVDNSQIHYKEGGPGEFNTYMAYRMPNVGSSVTYLNYE